MSIFGNLFARQQSPGDAAFNKAMRANTELISHMREASQSKDAVRGLLADIWAQHHNIPFMTTVYQAVQEMNSATTTDQHQS
jgi:hypothetical protein